MTSNAITDDILRTLGRPGPVYFVTLGALLGVLAFGAYAFSYQIQTGLGVAGYQHPILWSVYITNFVFWIGITHSGTLISAVLFLFRARWRTGVARASEAMTVFAIMVGSLFPIIHLGRPWLFYWLLPYPNERQLWVNFRSPIIWDLFALLTYLTVSLVFLYVGLLPDIATARDKVRDWRRPIYRVLSLGWLGSNRQWRHYNSMYGLLAALAVPLAVSVHSVVSWDFAVTILPGWHSTIFAPYFVGVGHFLRCRHDNHAAGADANAPWSRALHEHSPLREPGQAAGRDVVGHELFLRYGIFRCLVQWEPVRADPVLVTHDRSILAADLGDVRL